jgi:hypothetical protein
MRLCLLAVLVLPALAACTIEPPLVRPPAGGPPVMRWQVPGIILPVQNGDQATAEGFAREYCSQYAARARPEMVNYGTPEPLLSYSCD